MLKLLEQKGSVVRGKKWKNKSGSSLYYCWRNMNRRCSNLSDNAWNRYGGRGIFVCDEWKSSFDSFFDWAMSAGYEEGLSLDRKDFNGNYTPINCRWITMEEQHNNESRNVFVANNGIEMTIAQWCKELGFDSRVAHKRHSAYGATTFDELFSKTRLSTLRKKKVDHKCVACGTKESTKWRTDMCANCYAKALRWSKKTNNDIAGYAKLVEDRLNGTER